eukprot:2743817-Rhodomonas_salina.1
MCPQNSQSPLSSDAQHDCLCNPGYYGTTGSLCQECTVDHWCPGGGEIFKCPHNSSSLHMAANSSSDCFCDEGFEQVNFTASEGPVCAKTGPVTCPDANMRTHSGLLVDCTCRPGYYALNDITCAYCPQNHFCLGGSHMEACHDHCPAGTVVQQVCTALNNTICTACPEGSWCESGMHYACAQHATSRTGASSALQCECTAGFTGPSGGPCYACPADHYCPGLGDFV